MSIQNIDLSVRIINQNESIPIPTNTHTNGVRTAIILNFIDFANKHGILCDINQNGDYLSIDLKHSLNTEIVYCKNMEG